jgi:chondroitin AC lyase
MPSEREIQKQGLTDFVGAVTNGLYGFAAFDFQSPHDPVCARKSWFFFDKEFVCLGAGISSPIELPVVTTVNQCLLRGDVVISINDKKSIVSPGEKSFVDVDWILQDGIGYLFPEPSNVNIKNNKAQGSWYSINRQTDSPTEEIELDVFKIWLDHGRQPDEETYEYIVVPATKVEALDQKLSKDHIKILSNNPYVQAVWHGDLKIAQVVFYQAGEIQISEELKLKCESPGLVMIRIKGNEISEISVSDPTRKLGKIHLSISSRINLLGETFKVVWNRKEKMSEFSIGLPQGAFAGKSVVASFD